MRKLNELLVLAHIQRGLSSAKQPEGWVKASDMQRTVLSLGMPGTPGELPRVQAARGVACCNVYQQTEAPLLCALLRADRLDMRRKFANLGVLSCAGAPRSLVLHS